MRQMEAMKDKWEEWDKTFKNELPRTADEISRRSREAYKAALRKAIEDLLTDSQKEWDECHASPIPYKRGLRSLIRGGQIELRRVLNRLNTVTPIE